MTVAALFVDPRPGGAYVGIPGVEVWGARRCPERPEDVRPDERDARLYAGPHPVVAHSPCARWGRYWSGNPLQPGRFKLGDDGGCFAAALAALYRWHGVLEHPEASHAWRHFGLAPPHRWGGWTVAGWTPAGELVWTCCVEQGHYGHRARKATWLLMVGAEPPQLIWGPSKADPTLRIDEGYHSTDERRRKHRRSSPAGRLGPRERAATPPAFRDVLLAIARSAGRSS